MRRLVVLTFSCDRHGEALVLRELKPFLPKGGRADGLISVDTKACSTANTSPISDMVPSTAATRSPNKMPDDAGILSLIEDIVVGVQHTTVAPALSTADGVNFFDATTKASARSSTWSAHDQNVAVRNHTQHTNVSKADKQLATHVGGITYQTESGRDANGAGFAPSKTSSVSIDDGIAANYRRPVINVAVGHERRFEPSPRARSYSDSECSSPQHVAVRFCKSDTFQMFVCIACREAKVKEAFSRGQWQKRDRGVNWPKCKVCKSTVMNPFKRATTPPSHDSTLDPGEMFSFTDEFESLSEEEVELLNSDEDGYT